MDLKKLLTITPITEDFKKEVLEKYDSLTADQIFELTELCWATIAEAKRMKKRSLLEQDMTAVAAGKKRYNPNDIIELGIKVDYEYTSKIRDALGQPIKGSTINQTKVATNSEANTFKTQPLPVDKTTSPPPLQKP